MVLTLRLWLGRERVGGWNAVDASHAGRPDIAACTPAGDMGRPGLATQALSAGGRRRGHAAVLRTRDGRVDDFVIHGCRHGSFLLGLLSVGQLELLVSALVLVLVLIFVLVLLLELLVLLLGRLERVELLLLMARRATARACSGLRR